MTNTAELKRFRRAWHKHRKLPRLWGNDELKVPRIHQFIKELHVMLGSFSGAELDEFIDDMGFEHVKGLTVKTLTAREIVDEILDVWDDGLELHSDAVEDLLGY